MPHGEHEVPNPYDISFSESPCAPKKKKKKKKKGPGLKPGLQVPVVLTTNRQGSQQNVLRAALH